MYFHSYLEDTNFELTGLTIILYIDIRDFFQVTHVNP